MSLSPAHRLHADFAALFGGQFESARLIQPAAPVTDDAGGLALHDTDGVPSDEQQHNDVS